MSTIELEIFNTVLATKTDLAEMEARLIKWIVASALGASVLFAFLAKLVA